MVSQVQAVKRQAILSAMLDSEDFPVPLPLVRLYAQVGRTEAGESGHFGRWQKISAIRDGGLVFNQHASLLARCLRMFSSSVRYHVALERRSIRSWSTKPKPMLTFVPRSGTIDTKVIGPPCELRLPPPFASLPVLF